MKKVLVFLFFFTLANSVYLDPPIENVTIWNNGRGIELSNIFYSNFSHADFFEINWYSIMDVNGSMVVAGISPTIDNTTTYGENTTIIIAKGHTEDHIIGKDGYTICDGSRTPTDSVCDFDYDGCAETENEFHVFTVIGLNLTLRNLTEYSQETEISHVLGKAYAYSPTNRIKLPGNVSKEMEGGSGKDILEVNMRGNMTFVYVINNRSRSGLDCVNNYQVIEKSLNFSDNYSCFVSGGESIFFIESPATNEQWFKSNKMSVVLISQVPVYKSRIFQNEEEASYEHMYNFNVTENYFGIKNIESIPVDIESFIGEINVTAGPLGNNNGFSYLYRFSHSYEKKIGENDFVLFVVDFFGRNKSIEQKIFSRQLSHGNQTETGEEADWRTTRKSVIFEKEESGFVELFFGMLGVLVIILFLRFVTR